MKNFDENIELYSDVIKTLAIFLKKKPTLREFLPGVEDLIDFGEAH